MTFDDPFALENPLENQEDDAPPDWFAAKAQVERDALRVNEALAADIATVQRTTTRLLNQHVRSHVALNRALAEVFAFAQRHRERPAEVVAALRRAGQPLTRATLGSPYLPYVRLLMPATDPRLQSRYATGLAYVAANGGRGDVAAEIGDRGGIEACARAFSGMNRRQALRKPAIDPLATVRAAYKAVPIIGDAITLFPDGEGAGLLLVERMPNGEVVAYAHVDNPPLTARAAHLARHPTTT